VSIPEGDTPAEPLSDALAAYDDQLAAGVNEPPDALDEDVDPELLADWKRLTAVLMLFEKAWPRGSEIADDPTITDENGLVQPNPGEASSRGDVSATAESLAHPDRHFGRFQIRRTLGRGGFGIVFLAWDPTLRRQVALKVPQPETMMTPDARKRFQREAQAAAGLDHPNIVPVYETGNVGSVTYIATAYWPGPTLADWLSLQPLPVPPRDAAALTSILARAVEHAHERGVLHRDLKPSNILLRHTADDAVQVVAEPLSAFEPRIADFSLAKIADGLGPDTRSGIPFGSPPYMAPEQAEGKLKAIGPQTDVYGLGCILYELLTGGPPFHGVGHIDTLRQVIADPPVPVRRVRKDTPIDLETITLKCLEKDPSRRYVSAHAMADDLTRWLAGESIKARPASRLESIRRWCVRPERIRDAGLSLLLIGLGFAAFCALGVVVLTVNPAGFPRPEATRIHGIRCIFIFYLPLALFGRYMLERKVWALWAGLVQSIILTTYVALSMCDIIIFDFGASGPDAQAGRFTFEMLCLTLFAFATVTCLVALAAHFANPRAGSLSDPVPT
jgi:hypothetical protein